MQPNENEQAINVLGEFIENAEHKASKKRKLVGHALRQKLNLERLKGIMSGDKMKKLDFVVTPLQMVYDHRKCNSCLEPATHVETMNLDPEYKRYLCSECVRKQ